MSKLHRFEYETNKKQMTMIFVYYLLTYVSIIVVYYYLAHVDKTRNYLDTSPSLIILMMQACDKGGIISDMQFYLCMGMFVFQIPSLLIIFNTIFVKRSSDIL